MINHHNAPNHRYNGYSYVPFVEHDDGEVRKATHRVVCIETGDETILEASPYRWLTSDEFSYHIDMLFGDVYGDSE